MTELHWSTASGGSLYRKAQGKLRRLEERLPDGVYVELTGDAAQVAELDVGAFVAKIPSEAARNVVLPTNSDSYEVDGIHVAFRKWDGPRHVWWTGMQTGEIPDGAPLAALRNRVETKCKKKYAKATDGLWLVVCAIPLQLDSFWEVVDAELLRCPTTGFFDCIFFWDAFHESVWRIDGEPRIVADPRSRSIDVRRLPDVIANIVTL